MTEIKKGTPVWVWDYPNEKKSIATYICYDEGANERYRHVSRRESDICPTCWAYAEPINETNDQALQLIAEAESKIAEAKKLLNAQ